MLWDFWLLSFSFLQVAGISAFHINNSRKTRVFRTGHLCCQREGRVVEMGFKHREKRPCPGVARRFAKSQQNFCRCYSPCVYFAQPCTSGLRFGVSPVCKSHKGTTVLCICALTGRWSSEVCGKIPDYFTLWWVFFHYWWWCVLLYLKPEEKRDWEIICF